MKYVKRVLAVVLVLALVFSLSGCTAFEAKMAKAANKMKKVDNFRTDAEFYLDADMKMMGQSLMNLAIGMEGTMDIDKAHGTGAGTFHVSMMDEEEADVLIYFEKGADALRTWTSADDGMTWTLNEQELAQGEGESLFDIDSITNLDKENIARLRKLAATFEEDGVAEIRGSESTIYRGTISVTDLTEDVDLSELLAQLSEGMGVEVTVEDVAQIGDIPVAIGIDNDSGLISGFAVDMTDMLQGIVGIAMKAYMGQMMGDTFEGLDLEALGVTMEVNSCEAECVLYDYNEVGDVVIPDDVRENAVLAENEAA